MTPKKPTKKVNIGDARRDSNTAVPITTTAAISARNGKSGSPASPIPRKTAATATATSCVMTGCSKRTSASFRRDRAGHPPGAGTHAEEPSPSPWYYAKMTTTLEQIAPFKNEVVKDFTDSADAAAMRSALESVKRGFGRHYPLMIAGKPIETEKKIR